MNTQTDVADKLSEKVTTFLAEHDPVTTDRVEFLRARFDAGLAWVHFPIGRGGLGLAPDLQQQVDARFAEAGAPTTIRGST